MLVSTHLVAVVGSIGQALSPGPHSQTHPAPRRDGGVVGMYGRKIGEHLRQGTSLHLYLPGPYRGVFNLEVFRASKTMIVCEALIDAPTFWCAGFRNVTSAYGIEGFTPRASRSLSASHGRGGLDRLRPRRGWRSRSGESGGGAHRGAGDVLPGGISEGNGRERVRASDEASGEGLRGGAGGGEADGARQGTNIEQPRTVATRSVSHRRRVIQGRRTPSTIPRCRHQQDRKSAGAARLSRGSAPTAPRPARRSLS